MSKSKLRDFDPESLLDPAPSSSDEEQKSNIESHDEEDVGREHYADVGNSKLRKKEVVPLGPQYTGSRISRDDVADEDSDDPFARIHHLPGSEGEEETEEEFGNGNMVGGEDEEESQSESEEGRVNGDVESGEDMEERQDEDEGEDDEGDEDDEDESMSDASHDDNDNNQAASIREMMKDQKAVAATISQAAKADVEKGQAIKTQRKTFDSLLNARIRLQKALISTNSMAANTCPSPPVPEAISAAEHAALTLLNNLTSLRSTLDSARAGQKRKRVATFTPSTPSTEIRASLYEDDSVALLHRNSVLEKWSAKTRGPSLSTHKSKLNASASAEQSLTSVLQSQLRDPERLITRTQIPRSCAPLQSAASISSSADIYDDADFYGLLLKELLEQRSSDLSTTGASEFIVQAPWQVAREAKTKKVVDTKASKGRKLRYTVHEKLQNFVAPEDRGEWGERQREELFAGLFGRKMGLGEEIDDVQSDEDREEEGLMLFRS